VFFYLEELSSSDCVPNCPSDGYDIWLLMHFISDEELDIGFTSCYIDLCSRLVLGYFDTVISSDYIKDLFACSVVLTR